MIEEITIDEQTRYLEGLITLDGCKPMYMALIATLEAAKTRLLPPLPEGWYVDHVSECYFPNKPSSFAARLCRELITVLGDPDIDVKNGVGDTPRAAVIAALEKINAPT